jgi:LAS seventeen-binding protein 1/2
LYDFETTEENEMKLSLAQKIELISKVNDQWWYGRNLKTFEEGYFPRSYVKEI